MRNKIIIFLLCGTVLMSSALTAQAKLFFGSNASLNGTLITGRVSTARTSTNGASLGLNAGVSVLALNSVGMTLVGNAAEEFTPDNTLITAEAVTGRASETPSKYKTRHYVFPMIVS